MLIKNFEEVIAPHIKPYVSFSYVCSNLLEKGENFGSTMFKVEITLINEDGEEEVLHVVAKTPPPKGFMWKVFSTVITFKKELNYYENVVPTLQNFLRARNLPEFMNAVPKFLGGRLTLKPNSDEVDEDALLILENLQYRGYKVGDKYNGFDLESAKFIIDAMAKIHAVLIAFREAFPSEFYEKILPPMSVKYNIALTKENVKDLIKSYVDFLKPFGCDLEPYQEKMVNNIIHRISIQRNATDNSNIFNTITHGDMWVNNILVKAVDDHVTGIKLVDFQLTNYEPGINDFILFLYTSVEMEVLKKHADYLIRCYYEYFVDALTRMKANVDKFTWKAFEGSIKPECRKQFYRIVKQLCPIFTKKEKVKGMENISLEDFKPSLENVHENFAARLEYVISEFIKRDWL